MNIVQKLTGRILNRLEETKTPCKNYATEKAADLEGQRVAKIAAEHLEVSDVDYIVFYVEFWGRWCVAFNLQKAFQQGKGGYIGICGDHFTY